MLYIIIYCIIYCYSALIKYTLFANAYTMLTIEYQIVLTFFDIRVACKRLFSVLRYLKNILINSTTNEHLEKFILMA